VVADFYSIEHIEFGRRNDYHPDLEDKDAAKDEEGDEPYLHHPRPRGIRGGMQTFGWCDATMAIHLEAAFLNIPQMNRGGYVFDMGDQDPPSNRNRVDPMPWHPPRGNITNNHMPVRLTVNNGDMINGSPLDVCTA